MGIGYRIKEIRESLTINQKDFAEMVGVSRSYISEIEAEKTKVSIDVAVGIATKMPKFSLHWLLTGEGEMYAAGSPTQEVWLNKKTGKPIAINELSDSLEMLIIKLDRAREEALHAKSLVDS